MSNNNTNNIHDMVRETVDMVNNMTADDARAAEKRYYGNATLADRGYRSFWD